MPKFKRTQAILILAISALPQSALAEPQTERQNMVEACGVIHRQDPSVAISQCLDFLQSTAAQHQTDWAQPFCRALSYYEPELFYSLYVSVPDCVMHNREG